MGATLTGSDGFQLDLERAFSAPRDHVYRAWTEREAMERWIRHDGEKNRGPDLKFDLRPSGGFRVEVARESGTYLISSGCSRRSRRPTRWCSAGPASGVLPDPGKVTSEGPTTVTIAFREMGDATALRLTQGTFPTAARRDADHAAWDAAFDALARWLGA